MKKIILMLLISLSVFANTHPNLSARYLEVKGREGQSFLADMLDIDRSSFVFEKRDKQYLFSLEFVADYGGEEYENKIYIDSYEEDREVLSVFFDEISGDSLKEIFLITKYEGKYKIYAYGMRDYRGMPQFELLKPLVKKLNKKFEDYSSLNASIVRKEIRNKLPVDITSINYMLEYNRESFYSNVDFLDGEFIAYFDSEDKKVDNLDEAKYYIKSYEGNIYGKYMELDGFKLVEVFEGRLDGSLIIKDGSYNAYDGFYFEIGSYKDNLKDGLWEINGHMYFESGSYIKGKREGLWSINMMEGRYKDGKKDGVWKSTYDDRVEVYEDGVLIN